MPLWRVKARSLANSRKVTKPQLAAMAAQILLGEALHEQTLTGISKALGVSVPYIVTGMSLPQDVRAEVALGQSIELFRQIFTMLKAKTETVETINEVPNLVPIKKLASG
jgi:hypothetical protein